MNQILKEGKAPEDWKVGVITPIYKKGDTKDCGNYRGITLLSTMAKVYARILEGRLRKQVEHGLEENQYGFRPKRGVTDPMFMLRQICEKTLQQQNKELHVCFIDLEKAYDRVIREDVWKILQERGVEEYLIKGVRILYDGTKSCVQMKNWISKPFETEIGLRQGCILSPLLFTIVLDEAIKRSRKHLKSLKVGYNRLNVVSIFELCYADDMVILAKDERTLQENLIIYNKCLAEINMKISSSKTKTMIVSRNEERTHCIQLEGQQLEQVNKFKYLGSVFQSNGKLDEEITERTGAAGRLFNSIKHNCLGKKEIPKEAKVAIFQKVALPILTYGAETWTTTEPNISRLRSTEMRFLRKIEGKTKWDGIPNNVYRENLKTKPMEQILEESQLRWYGHIQRMPESRETKTIYGTRGGRRGRGRPRKTWEEGVRKAVHKRGLTWHEAERMSQDRKIWREFWRKADGT